MNNATESLATSTEILNQLGGNRFIAMTGSKNFIGGKNSLSFKLTTNKLKATHCTIELDVWDTYTVTFTKFNMKAVEMNKKLSVTAGVYNDMLRDIFTKETGLLTDLAIQEDYNEQIFVYNVFGLGEVAEPDAQ